jgi:late competence protein required for DNA uptake (superfamily II DNA/RNA helicase)
MERRVYPNKYYCFRCGVLLPRPESNRPLICEKCIVERYRERKDYWKGKYSKSKSLSTSPSKNKPTSNEGI